MGQTHWDSKSNNIPFVSLSEADVIALVNKALSGNAARTSTYKFAFFKAILDNVFNVDLDSLFLSYDSVVLECELKFLPAPKILLYEENTKIILYSELPFANIPHEEKLWSCYLHACIKYLAHEGLTNSSLRQRFGLEDTAAAQISRLIKEAVSEGLIKPFDAETSQRYMKYIPGWA